MRVAPWIAVAVGVLLLPPLSLAWIAERGEVVVLETGAAGEPTRLWIVDLEGRPFVRGNRDGSWVARVRELPAVRLRRQGRWRSYRAVPRDDAREAVVGAMRAKYGVSERFRAAVRGDEASAVFELAPEPEERG